MPDTKTKKSKCKILFLGANQSGKSQLIRQLKNEDSSFQSEYRATLGAECSDHCYQGVNFELWDTAGQEQFDELTNAYYRSTDMIALCIDITQDLSKQNVEHQIQQIRNIKSNNSPSMPVLLVLTKGDKKDRKVVTGSEIKSLAERIGIKEKDRITVSAKDKSNLNKLLDLMVSNVEEHVPSLEITPTPIHKALALVSPGSDLYMGIINLNNHIHHLPKAKKEVVAEAVFTLINTLDDQFRKKQINEVLCIQAMDTFQKTCIKTIGSSHPILASTVLGIVVSTAVAVLAAIIGFAIGFAAGAWSGPGAFLTGTSAAVIAVCAVSAVTGVGAGFFANKKLYDHLQAKNQPILDVANSAHEYFKVGN